MKDCSMNELTVGTSFLSISWYLTLEYESPTYNIQCPNSYKIVVEKLILR